MVTRQDRLIALARHIERLERRKQKFGDMSKRSWSIRLWIFLGTTGALIVGLLLFRWPGALCLLPGVGAFIVMTRYHHKIACLYALHLLACLLRFLSCNSSG